MKYNTVCEYVDTLKINNIPQTFWRCEPYLPHKLQYKSNISIQNPYTYILYINILKIIWKINGFTFEFKKTK